MKNINQLLEIVIASDDCLRGFKPDDLPMSAKARIQKTLVSLESKLSYDELDLLEKWMGGKSAFDSEWKTSQGECCYYVFSDDSLYYMSSGDSEVWNFASDFAKDRIIPSYYRYDRELDKVDSELLMCLGGIYAEFVENSKR